MRGAALSDIHLGFRAFPATIDGRNAREVDVERAWAAAVDGVVEHQPDLVTVAGDVFHHPRVGTHALKAWRNGIRRVVEETRAHVVVIQGNHDAGRTAEVLTPIVLPDDYDRVHIVTTPRRIRLEVFRGAELHGDYEVVCEDTRQHVSVACFPFVARGHGETYRLDPDPEADVNVLLLHAAVRGHAEGNLLPAFYAGADALDVGREAERWDVVACGDYHEFSRLHPDRLAFYSGAIERTSSNIWDEHLPKGWVSYDTDARLLYFHEVDTRRMSDYDLGDFNHPPGVGAAEVNECLAALATFDRLRGGVVRFKVDAFPREERADIDWATVRELKASCLHFQLDLRLRAREAVDLGDRRERRALTLAEEVASFFSLDDESVLRIVLRYLEIEVEPEPAAPQPELEEAIA